MLIEIGAIKNFKKILEIKNANPPHYVARKTHSASLRVVANVANKLQTPLTACRGVHYDRLVYKNYID